MCTLALDACHRHNLIMNSGARYFATSAAFRIWLRRNHRTETELQVGYFKKHTGKPSVSWPESVAEALCYGWIDGIRKRIDDDRYVIRFTPRRPKSKWSAVNIRLIAELEAAGKMTTAGRAAFDARPNPTSKGYTYDGMNAVLDTVRLRAFKKRKAAWNYFEALPPGYRRKLVWWVMSAKRDETRDRRLDKLIESSAAGVRLM